MKNKIKIFTRIPYENQSIEGKLTIVSKLIFIALIWQLISLNMFYVTFFFFKREIRGCSGINS